MESKLHELIEDFLGDPTIRCERWSKRISIFLLQSLYLLVFCLIYLLVSEIVAVHGLMSGLCAYFGGLMLINAISCALGYKYNPRSFLHRFTERVFVPIES